MTTIETTSTDRAALYDRLVDALCRISRDGEVVVRGNDLAALLAPGSRRERVADAVAAELRAARTKFPRPQSSGHEGYAVLLEEVEELGEDVEGIRWHLQSVWSAVRSDLGEDAVAHAGRVEFSALAAAGEAVQVAAMARRFREDLGPGRP